MKTADLKLYLDICEDLEWNVYELYDGSVELEHYTNAGEDFIFTADSKNFISSVREYAASFDAEEHAAMWIQAKYQGRDASIPSIMELIEDADYIAYKLRELAIALTEAGDLNAY